MPDATRPQPILVRRYGRRRLYAAETRRYVSLEELRHWTATGVAFVVIDTESGADITRVLLA
jgi:polyhydroxyalkanoate synthesis regulator protein